MSGEETRHLRGEEWALLLPVRGEQREEEGMGRHYLATDRQQAASGEEGAWSQPLALGLGAWTLPGCRDPRPAAVADMNC